MNDQDREATLRREIPFLRDYDLQRDLRGHSRVPCFILQNRQTADRYFMKLYNGQRADELTLIQQVYERAKVPTARIIKTINLASSHQTCCIYEFITGPTLRELLRERPADQLQWIGYQVGTDLRKLAHTEAPQAQFQKAVFAENLRTLLHNAHTQKRNYNASHSQKLPRINLRRLERSITGLKAVVYEIPPTFTHGDINLYNIILHDGTPYLIDTDGGGLSWSALDFRGNCWWGWTGNNTESEHAVYRGIYQGYFRNHIPSSFHQELGFAIIYEFLSRLQRYAGIDEQTYYSFLRWHDILKLTNYFENYHFDWF